MTKRKTKSAEQQIVGFTNKQNRELPQWKKPRKPTVKELEAQLLRSGSEACQPINILLGLTNE